MEVKVINKVAKYLDVSIEKTYFNKSQTPIAVIDGKEYTGLATLLLKLLANSKGYQLPDKQQECMVYQWLEFVSLRFSQSSSHDLKTLFKELNAYLENCSYIAGYCKTLADIVIYYSICDSIASLSASEKESYIHLCRWFNHIQFDDKIRQDEKIVNFITNYSASRIKVD